MEREEARRRHARLAQAQHLYLHDTLPSYNPLHPCQLPYQPARSPTILDPTGLGGVRRSPVNPALPSHYDPVASNSAAPDPAVSKAELRRHFRRVRDRLDTVALSQQLCDRLARWNRLQRSQVILAYYPHNSELSLLPLMQLWQGKIWGLPRCLPKGQLAWHEYRPARDRLAPGKFGIHEPSASAPRVNLDRVDAVLVPALACDCQGYRLGYGGGYYDRLLG
ncbi:MAG: 5-formyltetrahydrofolate cyclo-ligase, partial [Cyanobacteria bacterium J06639_1]